jgi:hypothetical protein
MNTTGNKYGGRTKGTPNKLTSKIKEKLSSIISEAIDSLDLDTMSKAERLKLIQIGLTYIIPRLKQVEDVSDEMPTNFQIEIIESRSQVSDKLY